MIGWLYMLPWLAQLDAQATEHADELDDLEAECGYCGTDPEYAGLACEEISEELEALRELRARVDFGKPAHYTSLEWFEVLFGRAADWAAGLLERVEA